MITTDRDVFLGAHVTPEIKEAIRTIASRNGVSMSALVFQIVSQSHEVKAFLKVLPPPKTTSRKH